MDEEYVKISQLPQIQQADVTDEDLVLLSHAAGLNDADGNSVYISNKLKISDLKQIAKSQADEIAPDEDTIGFNSAGELEVQKVYFGNVIGLGELAKMSKADLGLGTLAGYSIWTGTRSEYDALAIHSNKTLYFIK